MSRVLRPLSDEVRLADHKARDHVAVAVDVLGGGVDDHVGPELQRLLQVGGGEGVVHDHADGGIVGVGDLRDLRDIHDLQRRVAGGLEVDDLRLRGQRGLDGLEIGEVGEGHLDAELGHAVLEQREGAAVERVGGEDLVAAHDARPKRGGDGAHAGGRAERGLAALEGRDLLLNGVDGGVGKPGVDVARLLSGKASAALLDGIELKGRGLIDGHGQRAGGVGVLADMDLLRRKSAFAQVFHEESLSFLLIFCMF